MKPGFVTSYKRLRRSVTAALLGLFLASTANADAYGDVNRLIRANKLADASVKVNSYLASNPRDPQMRFLKGVIQTDEGQAADAAATFTALTREFPELPEPYNNLAALYANAGEYDKARTALEMAIRLNPDYAIAYENLGDVQARLAGESYAKSQRLESSNPRLGPKLALIRQLFIAPTAKRKGAGASNPPAAMAPSTTDSAAGAASVADPGAGKPAR